MSSNDRNEGGNTGGVHRVNPDDAATDPRAAAQQEQVRRDHDALEEQARRVEASVPGGTTGGTADPRQAATDPDAAAVQDRVRADHDRMQESARRVEASVPAEVRDTPIQAANLGNQASQDAGQSVRNVDTARENADAARESARRVQDSVPDRDDRK